MLDPTCGEAAFLQAAARRLADLGSTCVGDQVIGVDIHGPSLKAAREILVAGGGAATLIQGDFFSLPSPGQLGASLPLVDAVVGNPPFIRYQEHVGSARARSARAALEQGVRLSGLASSWAALLVHACSFLKPDGRVAMVLPAELLTVGYAEPIRAWLRRRFAQVHLVMFERLQFEDATEKVLLLLAKGTGGCDAFSVYHVADAPDLAGIEPFDHYSVVPTASGKWTDLLMPPAERRLFRTTADQHFVPLGGYGTLELGSVTGANAFFCLSESTRREFHLVEDVDVVRICPPGSRHLQGTTFSRARWDALRAAEARVWLLRPRDETPSDGLARYIAKGEASGVPQAYKCQIRTPWWRSPAVPAPDFFFTYMSHRYPRLVRNAAGVTYLNSMHGLRLSNAKRLAKQALAVLSLNSMTMLGAELQGRSYGGGVLKMEPREAASLPVPAPDVLLEAWERLTPEVATIQRLLDLGDWTNVVKRVDRVLLQEIAGLSAVEADTIYGGARRFRERRLGTGAEGGRER